MSYKKANIVLPIELVEQIQNYIDGEYIYIPRKTGNKQSWGSNTDTKRELAARNKEIYKQHLAGLTINLLAEKYYLAEKSIERIISEQKQSLFY